MKSLTILVLTATTGILAGVLLGRSSPSQPAMIPTSDDGKQAQAYKEKVVAKVIRENAKDLQKCYFGFLNKKPKIPEGTMDVLMEVKENGKIASVEVIRSQFGDNDFSDCISEKIESYYFDPPPMGINRFISHSLAFKSEETAMREMQERANANKLPKTLPVNPK